MRNLKKLLSLAIVLPLLSGCTTSLSSCPPIKEYTALEQRKAANELAALPADSVVGDMIVDYGLLRDQIRLCR